MSLSREEVEHIALLARLNLTDEEKERYREQLSSILDHFAKLQQLDTSNVPPLSSVLADEMPLRDDKAGACLPPDQLLKNAPQAEDNQFRVPPVLDHEAE